MKLQPTFRAAIIFAVTLLASHRAQCQPMTVVADRDSSIYHTGDSVHWTIDWQGDGEVPQAAYAIKSGGRKIIEQGNLEFHGKTATVEARFDAPNTMLVAVSWRLNDKENHAFGGAVADPDKIRAAAPEPGDFNAFWQAKLEELSRVPADPQLEGADGEKNGVAYWKITLNNIRGAHIRGQIARPEKGDKFPALLILQYAGVYPLQKPWVTDRAADGWLAMDIEAHDLPIDEPDVFYKEQFGGPLKNYWSIGNDDPETSYYLRMYLSCYRSVEYLKSRPDWNGKTLVVMGTSQGGQQALAAAGLHPDDISAVIPFLPAACDMGAPDVDRAAGFPDWWSQTAGKDPEKVRAASRYYEPAYFARRIRCPVLSGLGLLDDLAPPSSVLAALNEVTTPKEVIIIAKAGHQDENGSQRPYYDRCYGAWLPELREGNPAPVAGTSSPTTKSVSEQANADGPDQPVPQNNPLFLPAHRALLEKRSQGVIDVYFLGDSITRRWQGTDYPEHKKNWDMNFHGWNAADFGWGGDSTQNVLWRLQNGELDGVNPKVVVLMAGTNNVGPNVPASESEARAEGVAKGIRAILDVVREKAPEAKIVLMGITPRNDAGSMAAMPTIDKINARIATFADGQSIVYLNINEKLADGDGKLFAGVTEDGLHLSLQGYQIWADALKPLFTEWLGPPAAIDKAPPASGVPSVPAGSQ